MKEYCIFVKEMIKYIVALILYVRYLNYIDFTKNIFHTLTKGTYYLRLEIDW
jgi:hypothetical protein